MIDTYAHRISNHAVTRFRERVKDVPEAEARSEILVYLASADPKHLRRIDKTKRRTVIVPTEHCVFVFSHGNMVTVLKELRQQR